MRCFRLDWTVGFRLERGLKRASARSASAGAAAASWVATAAALGAALAATSTEAQAQAATPGPQGPGFLMQQGIPILMMIGVFYLFIIRPQMRRQKEQKNFWDGLKHGDSVVTSSGMLGVVREIQGAFVTLEVSQGVRVKFLKSAIAQSAEAATAAARAGGGAEAKA